MAQEYLFKGFKEETFTFFKNLKNNNNKSWFETQKSQYQTFLLEPFRDMVQDLGDFMVILDPYIDITPAVNRTISRIYRDTRFTNDKSPYKTTMWFTFKRPRKDWKDAPAFFFELSADSYRYGMGYYSASPSTMSNYRDAIDEDPDKFLKAISFFPEQDVFIIEGEKYVRIFDKSKPSEIQDWYQRKNLYFVCNKMVDSLLFSRDLIDRLIQDFSMLQPAYKYFWEIRKTGKQLKK
jgi:uncharacterized protein (TIGR02453 family)